MIRTLGPKLWIIPGICCLVGVMAGCMGSPVYRLWHRNQWLEDEKYGPTLHKRSEDLADLRREAAEMTPNEQMLMAQQLSRLLGDEATPIYRAEIVRTLGSLETPAAIEGLQIAIRDSDASVRVTACRAWGNRGGDEAVRALSEVIGADAELDVRIEAARQLGRFEGQSAAVQALGLALDDTDPALQHRAVRSLKEVTGEDYGDSVPAWRQYVRGETPHAPEAPSIADHFRTLF